MQGSLCCRLRPFSNNITGELRPMYAYLKTVMTFQILDVLLPCDCRRVMAMETAA